MKSRRMFLLVCVILMTLSGCSRGEDVLTVTAGDVTALVTVSGDMASTEFFAMDTLLSLTVWGKEAAQAASFAVEEAVRLEDLFSVTIEGSDVWRVNRAGGETVRVSGETSDVLAAAQGIARETGGAFDVTVRSLVQAWGFDTEAPAVPKTQAVEEALALTGYEKVSLNGADVTLPKGVRIDLGGIAKGYASHFLCRGMEAFDVEGAIFSLGGNVQTWGSKPDGSSWKVAIRSPFEEESDFVGVIACRDTAVVTSGSYERYFVEDGVTYGHILDPRTGDSVRGDLASVTVVCEDGARADALSTALFVMGEAEAEAFWRETRDFSMILVTVEGEVLATEDLDEIFTPGGEYTLIPSS